LPEKMDTPPLEAVHKFEDGQSRFLFMLGLCDAKLNCCCFGENTCWGDWFPNMIVVYYSYIKSSNKVHIQVDD
jgi:hypothetical protein